MAAPVGGKAANLGVGIDIERICVMDETMQHLVYTPEEQDLLASVCKATEYGKERWYTVGWAAKEAAAKSVGSGLQGAPHAYHILSIDRKQKSIVIGWHGTSIPIMFTNLTNMPNEPEYVVAWTNTVS
jgi:phosphopantetheinyl transferase